MSFYNQIQNNVNGQSEKKYLKSQWEFKVKTIKLPKARENAGDQVVIGFSSWIWLVEKVEQFFWTNHITK